MNSPHQPKILVGIDGSPASKNGLRWATSLAEQSDGTITAMLVWTYPPDLLMPELGGPLAFGNEIIDMTRRDLASLVAAIPNPERVTEQRTTVGSARAVLTHCSVDHDVLVLGRTGHSGLQRLWLGSTASHCVRQASCPVVIVDESTAVESTITVAVDGSVPSIEALVWAIGLGDDRDVIAVYSQDLQGLDDLPLDDQIREKWELRADEMLADAVASAVARTGADEGRIKRQVRQGDPRTTIVDQADPGDLLVLGARGRSLLSRWMLGSLADYAVHHAPGSVAIWRNAQ